MFRFSVSIHGRRWNYRSPTAPISRTSGHGRGDFLWKTRACHAGMTEAVAIIFPGMLLMKPGVESFYTCPAAGP
jgi:hypothetical protein